MNTEMTAHLQRLGLSRSPFPPTPDSTGYATMPPPSGVGVKSSDSTGDHSYSICSVVATSGSILEPGVSTTGGITQEYLTQGKGKDFGNPFRDMTAQERKVMTDGMANEYSEFVAWVARNRDIPAQRIIDDLGAYIYDPKTAIAKKLIDAQLGPDEAFRDTMQLMGLDAAAARVAKRKAASALEQLLGASSRIYGYQAAAPAGTKAYSVLCTGAPQPLLWHGPVTAFCG